MREGRDPREDRLRQLVKKCCISFSHLTLNGPNLVVAPHRDGKNAGEFSHICFLCDFDGGELYLEDGTVLADKYVWHKFDGKRLLHWNSPTKGEKWSLVAYHTNESLLALQTKSQRGEPTPA